MVQQVRSHSLCLEGHGRASNHGFMGYRGRIIPRDSYDCGQDDKDAGAKMAIDKAGQAG